MNKLLLQLRSALQVIDGKIDALEKNLTGADEVIRDMTQEEADLLAKYAAERGETEKRIKDTETLIASRAETAKPANKELAEDDTEVANPRVENRDKLDKAAKVGLVIGAMVKNFHEGERGPRAMLKTLSDMGYSTFAREFDAGQKRALSGAQASAGGVLIPENMSADIVDLLYPATTFLQGNPMRVPMPNGNYSQPAGASGASAAYRGEGKSGLVSQPSFKKIGMSAKMLMGIVPVTNQLIRWSLPSVQQFVNNDLSMALGLKMDAAFFRGDGTVDTPLGITNISGIFKSAVLANTVTPTYTQVDADAARLELVMENVNLSQVGVEWRMSPRVVKYLQNMRDGNGNKIYPELSLPEMRFRMRPLRMTSQIPSNLGAGTNESEIYLIAFGHVMMGETLAMQFSVSDQATLDPSLPGALSLWQTGMTAVKAEMEHDVDIRYFEAVCVGTAVKWGA
jgi:HK97 family phage major capsid protein